MKETTKGNRKSKRRKTCSGLIAELAPGKKGGDFELPFGGKISIESGLLGKKDLITCCMISPCDRYKYLPPLRSDEHLLSEIFLLAMNMKSLKRNLLLKLPYYPENFDLFDMQLLWKPPDGEEWMNKEFTKSESGLFVEFATLHAGIYVVTSHPRRERFTIPVNGCLFNSKLSHQISVRFPKKATDVDILCDIQISPMNRENLAYLRQEFPLDMADLITASDFVEVRPKIQKEFRRHATIKLPLPVMEQDNFPNEDLAIMHVTPQGWELLDVPLKITKSAVSFDTKILTKYCVALAKPQRIKRLREAFKHMNDDSNTTRGELLPFIHLQEKLWTLWFECVPTERKEAIMKKRRSQGFVSCRKVDVVEDDDDDVPSFRRHWKSRQKQAPKKPQRTDMDLKNGQSFELQISGDVVVSEDDPGQKNSTLYFLDRLPENYRKFLIEPTVTEEGKSATGHLKAATADPEAEGKTKTVAAYSFEVNPADVKAYHYVEPEPEPEPPAPTPTPEVEIKPETPPPPPPVKKDVPNSFSTSFLRLIKPTKPPRQLIKESKVLTGRSLMNLAKEVDQGLTLAIHLDISDSTITGMGFDALASGLNLVDITYRILMLWKRRTSKFKGRQPDILASALQEMGRNDLATVVLQCHRDNREIMPDSFECTAEQVANYNNQSNGIQIY